MNKVFAKHIVSALLISSFSIANARGPVMGQFRPQPGHVDIRFNKVLIKNSDRIYPAVRGAFVFTKSGWQIKRDADFSRFSPEEFNQMADLQNYLMGMHKQEAEQDLRNCMTAICKDSMGRTSDDDEEKRRKKKEADDRAKKEKDRIDSPLLIPKSVKEPLKQEVDESSALGDAYPDFRDQ